MFQRRRPTSSMGTAAGLLERIYHGTVRHVRKDHGNAVLGLVMSIAQAVVMILVFYMLFSLLGLKGMAIRGDFMLFLMSGIFMFMTHTRTVGAVVGVDGPTSAIMKHAPMNTIIAIASAALGTLYIQVLTMVVLLFVYHALFTPISIHDPVGAFAMVLLSWFTGIAVGLVFLSIKPWAPGAVSLMTMIYRRGNMIASGKMFVANAMPTYILAMFWWNPLFHTIDQARGFVFLNYNPHYSSITYPIYVAVALVMIGLMGEFFTRRRASASWGARR